MIIKRTPEDFVVEEIPEFRLIEHSDYAVYKLKKINFTTNDAIEIVARRAHTLPKNIKFAGNKDKNATTTQYISIYKNSDPKALSIKENILELDFIGFTEEPISLGCLKGNRFEIVVSAIKDHTTPPSVKFLVPNYFDEQRFSEKNTDIGMALLKKDFKKASEIILLSEGHYEDRVKEHLQTFPADYVGAIRKIPKKILLLFIHSVQSYIFNTVLCQLLKDFADKTADSSLNSQNSILNPLLNPISYYEIPYSKGNFIFYTNLEDYYRLASELDKANQDITSITNYQLNQQLTLIGFDKTDNLSAAILKTLNLSQRDFIIKAIPDLTVEGDLRPMFSEVTGFREEIMYDNIYDKTIHSDKNKIIKFCFSLNKGSYATIVIKNLCI